MTDVTLVCTKSGMIKKCQANGHAGFSIAGADIVCSAVTILLRTAMQLLSQMDEVRLNADTASRGNLAFCVEVLRTAPETEGYLKCIGDYLRKGFASLAEEYPENVRLRELTDN